MFFVDLVNKNDIEIRNQVLLFYYALNIWIDIVLNRHVKDDLMDQYTRMKEHMSIHLDKE